MAKYPARGNVPTGKVQRKFYIAEELADLLRIEAAKRNESQSAIVERALRRELGIMDRRMTVQDAVDTIARLRARASLSRPEQQELAAAWAVLHRSGVTVRYQAWLGDQLLGEGDTEEAAIDAAVAAYEQAIGYGDKPHLYADREELVAALSVVVELPDEAGG